MRDRAEKMLHKTRNFRFGQFAKADCVGKKDGNNARTESITVLRRCLFGDGRARRNFISFSSNHCITDPDFLETDNLRLVTKPAPGFNHTGRTARTVTRFFVPNCQWN